MKKSSTYYFVALAIISAIFAYWSSEGAKITAECYSYDTSRWQHTPLPPLTAFAIQCALWPLAITAISILGLVLSVASPMESHHLNHLVIAQLLVMCLLLFLSMIGYIQPEVAIPYD